MAQHPDPTAVGAFGYDVIDEMSIEASNTAPKVGDKISVNVTVVTRNNGKISWCVNQNASSDESVLAPADTWEYCRNFTAKSSGKATITATMSDSAETPKTASVDVVVS